MSKDVKLYYSINSSEKSKLNKKTTSSPSKKTSQLPPKM